MMKAKVLLSSTSRLSSATRSSPLLLLSRLLFLSPVYALAFRSSRVNTFFTKRDQRRLHLHGSRKNMKSLRKPNSFSAFVFDIRGGGDDTSVTSDETSSLTDDNNKMKPYVTYGTPSLVDEESASLFDSESHKMKPIEVGDRFCTSSSQCLSILAAGVLSPVKYVFTTSATYYARHLAARPVRTKAV